MKKKKRKEMRRTLKGISIPNPANIVSGVISHFLLEWHGVSSCINLTLCVICLYLFIPPSVYIYNCTGLL